MFADILDLSLLQEALKGFFYAKLTIGETSVTVISIFYLIIGILILLYVAQKATHFLERKLLTKKIPDQGTRATVATLFKYAILFLGFIIVFQIVGFNLGTFGLLAGALSVGIGFGLQNIAQNFIAGFIILFERPIKVGDRIEVGEIRGDVVAISLRSTKILTNDNISVIVPNSEFINDKVINWSYNERRIRFKFPISVSYNEDPNKVKDIVLGVARKHEGVLKNPEPQLWFDNYGDSSLDFLLVVWSSNYIQRPPVLKSALYYEIFEAFAKEGIEIPFPQRDLNFKAGFEPIATYFSKQNKNKQHENHP